MIEFLQAAEIGACHPCRSAGIVLGGRQLVMGAYIILGCSSVFSAALCDRWSKANSNSAVSRP